MISEGIEPSLVGLEATVLPLDDETVLPDGIEPSFPACRAGVLADELWQLVNHYMIHELLCYKCLYWHVFKCICVLLQDVVGTTFLFGSKDIIMMGFNLNQTIIWKNQRGQLIAITTTRIQTIAK